MNELLDNPYRSPHHDEPLRWEPNTATLIDEGWLYRKLLVPAPVDAVIEYNGRGFGFETVYVDGRIARRDFDPWWFARRFDFAIPDREQHISASVEVRVALSLALTSFVVTVDGRVVYHES